MNDEACPESFTIVQDKLREGNLTQIIPHSIQSVGFRTIPQWNYTAEFRTKIKQCGIINSAEQ
jgi:hypothetical protein